MQSCDVQQHGLVTRSSCSNFLVSTPEIIPLACSVYHMHPQLGKSSLAMEVDAGMLGGRVLAALRAERWRTAAESAMRNPSRATGDIPIPGSQRPCCLAHNEAQGMQQNERATHGCVAFYSTCPWPGSWEAQSNGEGTQSCRQNAV